MALTNIALEVLDIPDLTQTQFGPDMKRWLTNVVDIINASFMTLSQAFQYIFAMGTIDVGGGGAGPLSVTVTGLTATGYVTATLISSTNSVMIDSVVPGSGSFAITFSGDPGASAIIVYQAYMQQPQ